MDILELGATGELVVTAISGSTFAAAISRRRSLR